MQEMIDRLAASVGGTWLWTISLAAIGFILSCIEVSKIKLNPWTAIKHLIWRFLDVDHTRDRLGSIETKLDKFIAEIERREAQENRRRILAFEREIQCEVRHLREEFEDTLETIRQYEIYCKENPTFRNGIADEAIAHIREIYRDRLRKRDFGKENRHA